ncbi:TPA: glycosyltransferase family 2 protein [Clostridioides difficile]|nr:glycosyltransferase family 2 protein [Clostridioides difficile]EQE00423.1 glycosyl transferase 2 family protein [Clostridioides difficile CD3]EQG27722.1 glycosyl transferase 2 family protein [Clostridioides difficile DA00126]EQG32805.1 glycosyl transferase 2 family protein [Clostridioides difficile DA00129]EQG53136.1 glycosyl transferase 2 family protein [Clostridioides difficile DA00142]EQG74399.1 glycosyl transferase 2 family protein [Clostridioides difficile DA00165]EQG90252.1 glycosyl 
MNVSIIIPTKNAEKYIENLIKALINQTIEPCEIIVIDTESKDKTVEICMEYDIVKFIQIKQSEFGHGSTRNRAAKLSKGDILVFMTQDALPQNCYFIEELIKPLGKNNIVCTYGRQLPRNNAKTLEVFSRSFNYGNSDIIKSKEDIPKLGVKTFFFSNVCSSFIKRDFFLVDGFPENIIMNEDMIISSKIIYNGKKTCYASKAIVTHSHRYTYLQQFKRNFDIGVAFKENSYYLSEVKSESEGFKFVIEAIKFLFQSNKCYLIPSLFIESGFKFFGYKFGMNYKNMPIKLVKLMSMHSFYFDRKEVMEEYYSENSNNRC